MINFSVIGIMHGHIYGQIKCLVDAGATFHSWIARPSEHMLEAEFTKAFPNAAHAASEDEILNDNRVQLVITSTIPVDRAPLGISVMLHGKDFMSDKPGFTTLEQLNTVREVQKRTQRIYSICFSERFENRATVRAGELVRAGAIGRVLQTVGLGPHRVNPPTRQPYFFDISQYGGILCDIASHQFDQFLYFTGSTEAHIVASQAGNVGHPEYPGLQDFGDVVLRGNGGSGYVRVDWFTPAGLPTWGDGRLTILGTQGYIELRKYLDIAGRPGGNHLFLVDTSGTQHIQCDDTHLPYGSQLIYDVLHRTETAMTQQHAFLASELALTAQLQAQPVNPSIVLQPL